MDNSCHDNRFSLSGHIDVPLFLQGLFIHPQKDLCDWWIALTSATKKSIVFLINANHSRPTKKGGLSSFRNVYLFPFFDCAFLNAFRKKFKKRKLKITFFFLATRSLFSFFLYPLFIIMMYVIKRGNVCYYNILGDILNNFIAHRRPSRNSCIRQGKITITLLSIYTDIFLIRLQPELTSSVMVWILTLLTLLL